MNKTVLYAGLGIGAALIGYVAYRYMGVPTQVIQPTSVNPYTHPGPFTTSNQQTYPFQANVPPRVDNSNQPWANNNRAELAKIGPASVDVNLSNVQMVASFAKSANELVNSVSSLDKSLNISSWFSSGDASETTQDWSF